MKSMQKLLSILLVLVMLVSLLQSFSGQAKQATALAGAVAVASILLLRSDSLIHLGADTVRQLSEYGKLLLPVMTAAMASNSYEAPALVELIEFRRLPKRNALIPAVMPISI